MSDLKEASNEYMTTTERIIRKKSNKSKKSKNSKKSITSIKSKYYARFVPTGKIDLCYDIINSLSGNDLLSKDTALPQYDNTLYYSGIKNKRLRRRTDLRKFFSENKKKPTILENFNLGNRADIL